MKILVINQDWFVEEWRAMGHEIVVCGMNPNLECPFPSPIIHVEAILKSLPFEFSPDRIVIFDNSLPLTVTGLDEVQVPVVFYSVDTHHHAELHAHLTDLFDYTWIAQKDYRPIFEAKGSNPEWMPLWAPKEWQASEEKNYGAAFVGTMDPKLNPNRVAFFTALKERIPLHLGYGEYWKIFPHAEIVINQTVKGDLNFRVFEAMMCGPLLLTENNQNGLKELFTPGTHLAVYEKGNVDDAVRQLQFYLENQSLCRTIGKAGREEILKNHRPLNRAKRMLDVLLELPVSPKPRKRLAVLLNFSALYQASIKTEPHLAYIALNIAFAQAQRALSFQDPFNSMDASHAVMCCLTFDKIFGREEGRALIYRLAEAYPENPVFTHSKIRSLLNEGRLDDARVYSEIISDLPPEETFARSEELIMNLLEYFK